MFSEFTNVTVLINIINKYIENYQRKNVLRTKKLKPKTVVSSWRLYNIIY